MLHDQGRAKKLEIPNINYVWVGPPATKSSSDQPGSDIAYVIEMMKFCKNPATYFCLDKHVEHFRALFAEKQVQINVESIESFLKKMTRSQDAEISLYAKKMLEILGIQLGPARNEIRDRVFFKDAFTFFLLAAQGGYTLDTNLRIVDPAKTFTLEACDQFKAPHNLIADHPTPDVFIMYAPSDNRDQANKMISYYLLHWDSAQKELYCSKDDIIRISRFHKAMAQLSIDSLITGLKPTHKAADDHAVDMQLDPAWQFAALRPDEFPLPAGSVHAVRIAGLPLIKIFSNSHKPEYEVKKLILNKIENYKNENPKFAKYKKPLVALLEQERARYNELELGKAIDIMTVNRRLYSMIEVFTALDKMAVEASEANSGLLSLFSRVSAKDMDLRIGLLYEKAAKIAAESIKENGQVHRQEFNKLFDEFKEELQSPAEAQRRGKGSIKHMK